MNSTVNFSSFPAELVDMLKLHGIVNIEITDIMIRILFEDGDSLKLSPSYCLYYCKSALVPGQDENDARLI